MCTVPAVAGSLRRRGHVVSPGYPHRYPGAAVTGTHAINCSLTVVVRPPTALVRLRVVDLFLASYTANNRRLCRDRSIHQSVKAATPTHTHPFDGPFSGTARVSRCQKGTRSSEGPRDASCQLKSCQLLPRNSAETTRTTSPEQIEVMKLEG